MANSFTNETFLNLYVLDGKVWRPIREVQPVDHVGNNLLRLQHKVLPVPKAVDPSGTGGVPKKLLSASATESPSKQQDRTFSEVSISFTRDTSDTNYARVNIWFTGYKGNTNPTLMASTDNSPFSFLCETTGETVTVTLQPVGASGATADLSFCITTTVALDGVVSAPPAPTVTQTAVALPLGVQFTFDQVNVGSTQDVIDSYKIYRNTVNNSATATVIATVKHSPANAGGPVVFQDHQAVGNTYYYWVSAVNTVGLESTLTSAGSIVIPAASMDSDVADGSTYGRIRLIALTNGSVDPSLTGMLMKGVMPPTFANGFTYTSTTTSITIAWNANQAIYRPDGTITQIPAGTQAVTGLTVNTSYYFYPYWDEASSALKWITNTDVTYPSIVGVTFNGTNQEVTTATQFALASAFTLEAWYKLTSSSANNLGIITHGSPQTGNLTSSEAGIYIASGKVNCYLQNTTPATISIASTTAFNDGQWHHIVMTLTGGVMTVYSDGVQMAQNSSAGSISTTSAWFRLARGNVNNLFPGTLSRVAYYNTALNLQQINNHYEAGNTLGFTTYDTTVANDSPVYYWKLVDTSGSTAADSAGSNTGTYTNSPTLNQSSAVFAADGSPAIAWSSDSLLNNQALFNRARVPLTPGSLNFATTSTGTGGGGGGGSGSGGGGFGGRACFSPNTKVKTIRGDISFDELEPGDAILTAAGTRCVVTGVSRRPYRGPALNMGQGELVTPEHLFLNDGKWARVDSIHPEWEVVHYEGDICNAHILTEDDDDQLSPSTEHSYTLSNGCVVHNFMT